MLFGLREVNSYSFLDEYCQKQPSTNVAGTIGESELKQ